MSTKLGSKAILNQIVWPDAELISIRIDYDALAFEIKESNGLHTTLVGHGYVGLEGLSIWDEMILESAEVADKSPILDKFVSALHANNKSGLPESGSADRNRKEFYHLKLVFIDGSVFNAVLNRLELVRQTN